MTEGGKEGRNEADTYDKERKRKKGENEGRKEGMERGKQALWQRKATLATINIDSAPKKTGASHIHMITLTFTASPFPAACRPASDTRNVNVASFPPL